MQLLHPTSKQRIDLILIQRAHIDRIPSLLQLPIILIEVDIRSSIGDEAHPVLIDQLHPEELIIASCTRVQTSVNDAFLCRAVSSLLGLEETHCIEIEGYFGC